MATGVGIIGVGRAGGELHMPDLAKLDTFNIIGVYDVCEERARQRTAEHGGTIFPSYEAMLADPEVELAVVTTPSNSHAEYVIQALEAGKHVVVDKPTATTLDDVERMFAAAERCGRILTTYQSRRWDGDFLAVRNVLSGDLNGDLLGEPWLIETRVMGCGDTGWGDYGLWGDQWRLRKAYGGGFLLDWGAHIVDHALMLDDSPVESVFADVRGGVWSQDADDHFMIIIRFANGTIANCVGSAVVRYTGYRWFIGGTNGTLAQQSWGDPIHVRYRKEGKNTDTTVEQAKTDWSRFYVNLADVLAGKAELAVKPEETLRLFKVFEAARESARTGNSVRVTP